MLKKNFLLSLLSKCTILVDQRHRKLMYGSYNCVGVEDKEVEELSENLVDCRHPVGGKTFRLPTVLLVYRHQIKQVD
ncbi:Uncharacterized protein APZ42_021958 [Daphnia magna]|uniref:Uncharacterized protein n=1 Tax=Daphnia magna TaxID=35525 RepID=A0A164W7M3_9CRUS|nr:Uncharacterized protein APZ42_021958 [Daphnia magna]